MNYYNKPEAPEVNGRRFTMRSKNINWPIPYWAIDANRDINYARIPDTMVMMPVSQCGKHGRKLWLMKKIMINFDLSGLTVV